jgi:alkylation response protein AidB-like acyl-CoA dehydrogenase
MNFEFSEDAVFLKDQVRDFLREKCDSTVVRRVLDGQEPYARQLWQEVAEMGWPGAAIPEEYGGVGLGYEGLCVLAEELGRVVAPIPFSSSIYLAAEAILMAGSESDKQELLPKVADGSLIGTFAWAEGFGHPEAESVMLEARNGSLTGMKWPVPDGSIADFAIVAAKDEHGIGLYRVDLEGQGVARTALASVDPTRNQARLEFSAAPAFRLGTNNDAWPIVQQILDRASILFAFEQVGGADAALMMARDHSLQRYAFGRPIATFQALKHKLADVYVALELARSNCYYGCWAISDGPDSVAIAAAGARVACIHAYHVASKENIQVHGGAGFTWEYNCQFYYRRSKYLALVAGGAPYWKNRLIERVEAGDAL